MGVKRVIKRVAGAGGVMKLIVNHLDADLTFINIKTTKTKATSWLLFMYRRNVPPLRLKAPISLFRGPSGPFCAHGRFTQINALCTSRGIH